MNMWLSIFALLVFSKIQLHVHGNPQVPCYFIFGDSLVDNGNNNQLQTKAKVNYLPYGVDYPSGPTGRFSNGRTTADFLAEFLGFDHHIPPFTTARGSDILEGVNYASGSAGIRNETGQHLGVHVSLDGQLKNHRATISRIFRILGKNVSTSGYLKRCLYSVGMGSNDYINNYFLTKYSSKRLYSPKNYAKVLIQQYSQQIKRLYSYGARKVVVFGVGIIGCTPNANSLHGKKGSLCVDKMNHAVRRFNTELKSLINQLNADHSDAKFIYINAYRMASMNVSSFGFKVWDVGCCPVGKYGQCDPDQQENICKNRSEYLFWDSFHPTEIVNNILAARAYKAFEKFDTYPTDISHLAKI
ncbi:hypothetical protein FH972_001062 [Carpinus fangiana]|uniref:Uncharacterized protein n=1 Tax=Carpinus fangiana TaxID=176857 RepID=A0A5N6QCZ0_9ROSI|nr:hypothetical protein FH972_001062 [Carpinus fangiana]